MAQGPGRRPVFSGEEKKNLKPESLRPQGLALRSGRSAGVGGECGLETFAPKRRAPQPIRDTPPLLSCLALKANCLIRGDEEEGEEEAPELDHELEEPPLLALQDEGQEEPPAKKRKVLKKPSAAETADSDLDRLSTNTAGMKKKDLHERVDKTLVVAALTEASKQEKAQTTEDGKLRRCNRELGSVRAKPAAAVPTCCHQSLGHVA